MSGFDSRDPIAVFEFRFDINQRVRKIDSITVGSPEGIIISRRRVGNVGSETRLYTVSFNNAGDEELAEKDLERVNHVSDNNSDYSDDGTESDESDVGDDENDVEGDESDTGDNESDTGRDGSDTGYDIYDTEDGDIYTGNDDGYIEDDDIT